MGDIERDPVAQVANGNHLEFIRVTRQRIVECKSKEELEIMRDDLESLLDTVRDNRKEFEESENLFSAFKGFISELKTMICAATNRAQLLKA